MKKIFEAEYKDDLIEKIVGWLRCTVNKNYVADIQIIMETLGDLGEDCSKGHDWDLGGCCSRDFCDAQKES